MMNTMNIIMIIFIIMVIFHDNLKKLKFKIYFIEKNKKMNNNIFSCLNYVSFYLFINFY